MLTYGERQRGCKSRKIKQQCREVGGSQRKENTSLKEELPKDEEETTDIQALKTSTKKDNM